jgi:transposase
MYSDEVHMERLERKKQNGKFYYYYSSWKKVNGKCRRQWQVYLGKLEDIVNAVQGGGSKGSYAEIFQRGLPLALWKEARSSCAIEEIDNQCVKRNQGMSTGEYIVTAAINRAIYATSKRSMWEWFSDTILVRLMPKASKDALTSQRFWDHMDRIQSEDILKIWSRILSGVMEREKIDLTSIQLDGTNFYTFIDSFNGRCDIAQRGRNKQKRSDLRQVNYSLFCSGEHHLPLFFDTYRGNRHDSKQFPLAMKKFDKFFQKLFKSDRRPEVTLIFDKGNNSTENLKMIDEMKLNFVGSIKLTQARDLVEIPNDSDLLKSFDDDELEGTRAYRLEKKVLGNVRTVILTFNQNLFDSQWRVVRREVDTALEELSAYKFMLDDRIRGIEKRGKDPTRQVVKNKCAQILNKTYLKEIIHIELAKGKRGIPRLKYNLNPEALAEYERTVLGKNIIITSRNEWDTLRIIKAYRSQYLIEDVFREMKDRKTGYWWPMHHWTDSKIKVHAFYCSLGLLFRGLIMRKVKSSGIDISMKRLLKELGDIKEVINVSPAKGRQKKDRKNTIMSKLSGLQEKLVSILDLGMEKEEV